MGAAGFCWGPKEDIFVVKVVGVVGGASGWGGRGGHVGCCLLKQP